MKLRVLIFTAVVAVLLLGAYFFVAHSPGPTSSPQGDGYLVEAPAAEILAHIRSLNSPLTLVNFWASWCEPCKAEFPHLMRLRQQLAPRGLQVVFVSIDEVRDVKAAEEFLHSQKVEFATYYKGSQSVQFVTDLFPKWEGAVPTTVLFGPKLEIVEAWEGETSQAEFEKRVHRHLGGT